MVHWGHLLHISEPSSIKKLNISSNSMRSNVNVEFDNLEKKHDL